MKKLFDVGMNLIIFSKDESEKYNELISYLKSLSDQYNVITKHNDIIIDSISISRGDDKVRQMIFIDDISDCIDNMDLDSYREYSEILNNSLMTCRKLNIICVIIARIHYDDNKEDLIYNLKPNFIKLLSSVVLISDPNNDKYILKKSRDKKINTIFSMIDLI